jgi:hypothetical protein
MSIRLPANSGVNFFGIPDTSLTLSPAEGSIFFSFLAPTPMRLRAVDPATASPTFGPTNNPAAAPAGPPISGSNGSSDHCSNEFPHKTDLGARLRNFQKLSRFDGRAVSFVEILDVEIIDVLAGSVSNLLDLSFKNIRHIMLDPIRNFVSRFVICFFVR